MAIFDVSISAIYLSIDLSNLIQSHLTEANLI